MFDLLLTLVLIYFGYRGYRWYTHMQNQVKAGPPPNRNIDITRDDERDDYVDYEEVK